MSEHTKKRSMIVHAHSSTLHITHNNKNYVIPKKIADKYLVEPQNLKKNPKKSTIKSLFKNLDETFTKSGVLLKGLRLREGLSQTQFARMIDVTQANLSNMENGRRPIGKNVAKRIEKVFGTNYRYFLE